MFCTYLEARNRDDNNLLRIENTDPLLLVQELGI